MIDELLDIIRRKGRNYPYLWNLLKYLKNNGVYIYKLVNTYKWRSNNNIFNNILDEYAKNVTDFFFIQIGANDGVMADPIHNKIVKYNWKGILVEPQKDEFQDLKKNYRGIKGLVFENIAISNKSGVRSLYTIKDEKIEEFWQRGLATFCPEKNALKGIEKENLLVEAVKCITMDSLIKKHNVTKIDLLQIDVEGYDYEIIKLINFKKIKPTVIWYEHRCLKIKERGECKKYLKKIGYSIIETEFDTAAILDIEFAKRGLSKYMLWGNLK